MRNQLGYALVLALAAAVGFFLLSNAISQESKSFFMASVHLVMIYRWWITLRNRANKEKAIRGSGQTGAKIVRCRCIKGVSWKISARTVAILSVLTSVSFCSCYILAYELNCRIENILFLVIWTIWGLAKVKSADERGIDVVRTILALDVVKLPMLDFGGNPLEA